MKKHKKAFGRPVTQNNAELPTHLQGLPKSATLLKNATAEDFLWLGDDGKFNFENFLRDFLSPETLLKTVLEAIVVANPRPAPFAATRVAAAMEALVGTDRGGVGRRNDAKYDPALSAMSQRYFLGFLGLDEQMSSLNALSMWALRQDSNFKEWSHEEVEHRNHVLRRRFERAKDVIVAQLAAANLAEIQSAGVRVRAAIAAIKALGIQVPDPVADDSR